MRALEPSEVWQCAQKDVWEVSVIDDINAVSKLGLIHGMLKLGEQLCMVNRRSQGIFHSPLLLLVD